MRPLTRFAARRHLSAAAGAAGAPSAPAAAAAAAAPAAPAAPAADPYLHRSILPSSLLQLPIPTLQDTLSRYLRSLAPLVPPAVHAHTSALVASFAAGDGLRLQARLLDNARAAPHTSYISDDWFDMYLTNRCAGALLLLARAALCLPAPSPLTAFLSPSPPLLPARRCR